MLRYTLSRMLGLIPTLILVALISFFLIHLTPGDPAAVMLGVEATPERVANLRADMGLDQPLTVQFKDWVSSALQGDLGNSFFLGRPVAEALVERLPATFSLAVAALLVAVIIGVPAGIIAAARQNSVFDGSVMVIALLGISVPSFWLGLLLILIFSVGLGWFPTGGYVPISEGFVQHVKHLVLPAVSLGFMQAALIARMTRASMLEVIRKDYITTARSKGQSEFVVVTKHALKNIAISVLTVVGMAFGILLGGAVIVETVFAYPGVGRLVVQAVTRRDYPLIQGALLMIASIYVIVNLVVDLLYPLFDPRIKYE